MRHRRDHLGKDLLDLLLSRWGTLRTEVPVPATDAQRADVSFVPRAELPPSLGLLARLGAVPCLFELFSEGPSREELLACQRKLLQWRHALRKRHRDAEPMCWLLCAERPTLALHALGFAADGETPGIYRNAYGLRVIVLDQCRESQERAGCEGAASAARRDDRRVAGPRKGGATSLRAADPLAFRTWLVIRDTRVAR